MKNNKLAPETNYLRLLFNQSNNTKYISIKDFATKFGERADTMGKYLHGYQIPGITKIQRWCRECGFQLEDFYKIREDVPFNPTTKREEQWGKRKYRLSDIEPTIMMVAEDFDFEKFRTLQREIDLKNNRY